MKIFKTKNNLVVGIYTALENIELQNGKARRGKGKLMKQLFERNKEFVEEQNELKKQYFKFDEEKNKFEEDENNVLIQLDDSKKDEAKKELEDHLDEEVEISFVEHSTKLKALYDALSNDEFTGKKELNDIAFDNLMDALDETFEGDK